jgi:tetratricopeptide (TPR) repeat protein
MNAQGAPMISRARPWPEKFGAAASPDTLRLPADTSQRWYAWLFGGALVAIACVAFAPILHNEFVYWDDDKNFVLNRPFQMGGWAAIQWAWRTFHLGVYQPLAWLAFLAEHRLWQLNSWGYHLASLVIYCAALLSCYRLLLILLGRTNASLHAGQGFGGSVFAFSSLVLFAVHPLRVEAVAWASCQPYLLCLLFYSASAAEYLRAHSERIGGARRWVRLCGALVLFGAALLSKAAAMSLPAVLIALDYYPLKRVGWRQDGRTWLRILVEKIPFFLVAAAFGLAAIAAKRAGRALEAWGTDGVGSRVAQAGYAVWFYVAKTVWPLRLSHFYGRPSNLSLFVPKYALCVAGALAITAALFVLRRGFPAAWTAWLSYLIILAPAVGVIRFGPQIVADRFSLLATLPLFFLLASVGGLIHRRLGSSWKIASTALCWCVAAALLVLTRAQCAVWRTSETLWTNALSLRELPEAHNGLAGGLKDQGRNGEAELHYREALRLNPDYADAHNNFAILLDLEHRPTEALEHFKRAAELDPKNDVTIHNLAKAYLRRGQFDKAARAFAQLVELRPHSSDVRVDLGVALSRLGRNQEASAQYLEALRLEPDHPVAHLNFGLIYFETGDMEQAKKHFSKAAEINLREPLALIYLGLVESQAGNAAAAEQHYLDALRRMPDSAEAHAQLGALLTNGGRVLEGSAHLRAALKSEPHHSLANFTLARLMAKNGRTAEAREHLQSALEGHPSDPQKAEIERALAELQAEGRRGR